MPSTTPITTVDDYIASFPADVQAILQQVRQAIHAGVPGPAEKIRYGMAAVMLGGRYAIHFAGWKDHVGLYPVPTMPEPLEDRIAPYRTQKDTVRFRYAEAVPYDLITQVAGELAARHQD